MQRGPYLVSAQSKQGACSRVQHFLFGLHGSGMLLVLRTSGVHTLLWQIRHGIFHSSYFHFCVKFHNSKVCVSSASTPSARSRPAEQCRTLALAAPGHTLKMEEVEMKYPLTVRDTIAAISSGSGKAGVGVFRISGPRAGKLFYLGKYHMHPDIGSFSFSKGPWSILTSPQNVIDPFLSMPQAFKQGLSHSM